jgi:transposase
MDRKRKKKTSNEDWKSPSDGDAEITKLKDGRTALAYKAENAVDMETGAIVAVTTHTGAAAATVQEIVIEADVAMAGLIAEKRPKASLKCARKAWKKCGGEGSGVRQSAARSGRTRQADAAATGRAN